MLDLAINNGNVFDIENGQMSVNVGIESGNISILSKNRLDAKKVIDLGENMIVSPGFIDIHMHGGEINPPYKIDHAMFGYMALMGVTTCLGGNCGLGDIDITRYQAALPVNYLGLTGHGSLREAVGCSNRYISASRLETAGMSALLDEQLRLGSAGLSFGFEYTPGVSMIEILSLCEVVARHSGKIVAAHYRFDADRSLEAIAEMIIVAREAGVRFQISHLNSGTALGCKQNGQPVGHTGQSLQMIETANNAGVDIMADSYPYDAFCTFIGSAGFDEGCFERWGLSYDAIEVCEGKYKGQRCTSEIFHYLRSNEPDTLIVGHVMSEAEVIMSIQHPLVMIASDGYIKEGQGHPRAAGAFPKVLARYVREREVLDMETALKKMTTMPAARLSLSDRGEIKEGYKADITIFDRTKVHDRASYQEPTLPPVGIEHVIVDGVEVATRGQLTGNLPGCYIS